MAIPGRHGKTGYLDGFTRSPGDGSRSICSGHIEGTAWDIERLGSSYKVIIDGGSFDVSTNEGYAGLFRLIEALKDITRPVLSEAE